MLDEEGRPAFQLVAAGIVSCSQASYAEIECAPCSQLFSPTPCILSCSGGRGYASSDDESASLDGSSDSGASAQVVPQRSVLDALLLGEWEDRAEAGLFRYDVTACPTKVVPGSYGFIAQCNEGRLSKKRPTEFRIDQVCVCMCMCVCVAACWHARVCGVLQARVCRCGWAAAADCRMAGSLLASFSI